MAAYAALLLVHANQLPLPT